MPFTTSPSLRASTGILTNVPFISRSAALLERWREAEFHMHRLAFAEMVGGARESAVEDEVADGVGVQRPDRVQGEGVPRAGRDSIHDEPAGGIGD
jgi:hypothetical protein